MPVTKRNIIAKFIYAITLIALSLAAACSQAANKQNSPSGKEPAQKLEVADRFAYPVGEEEMVTAKKDDDGWIRELDFGVEDSLGEGWTSSEGHNKACGQPVFAAANGNVVYAEFAGPEWGLVVIIEHQLPSGARVQTLYGNLLDITADSGPVKMRQEIGHLGNANGRYQCRLHFEVRTPQSSAWNQPGPMTSPNKTGWLNPTAFIEAHR